jgi:hypothetical protein
VSAVESTRPHRHSEHKYDRLSDLHDQIAEAQSIETEKERATRIGRLKAEIEALEVEKVGKQHAASERLAQDVEAYAKTRDAYVEALDAFLSHVDAVGAARDAVELAVAQARAVGVRAQLPEDLATTATRSDQYPLRQLIARAQNAGLARAVNV